MPQLRGNEPILGLNNQKNKQKSIPLVDIPLVVGIDNG